jgi:hypothetical protein
MNVIRHFAKVASVCAIAGLATPMALAMFPAAAIADDDTVPLVTGVRFGEILNEYDSAYFSHGRTYYFNRTLPGQLKYLLGPFPDVEVYKDGKDINKLYRETLYRQMNSGPILRTIDLPTPFPFSLRTLPQPVLTGVIDSPAPVSPLPIAPPPAVLPPAPKPGPVPALW